VDEPIAPRTTEALALGELGESIGFLLRLAQLVSFRDFFDDLGGLGIRPGETSVLMLIGENPGVRQGVLARALMIKRAHMAKMMAAMERDGLVVRSVPEDDRRALALRLSEKGAAQVARLRAPFGAHEAGANRGLSAREAETLRRLLRKFAGITGPGARQ
jgi:DNA-binding MarR family transcriptional regulator